MIRNARKLLTWCHSLGEAKSASGGDGSSKPSGPMEIDEPEGLAGDVTAHGGQEGPPGK